MNIGHADFDILPELELALALGNLDRPHLPRPFIDVLEKVAVDCLQMLEIEIASWNALPDTNGRKPTLRKIQLSGVSDIQLVS
ncbi:hypothetical protein [Rhizobium sp. CF080]|uniref:hypothetical protein n=1 Tax=Rhizobium sp. (strain CF080) TaxID=1144310 RepID=UPI001FD98BB4|nr:hypothetical protein [Rhizobium sp. CF080]